MVNMTQPMLSESIWRGAAMKPQSFRGLFDDGGTCAIGAAMDAIGKCGHMDFLTAFPLLDELVECPTYQFTAPLHVVIAYLNNSERWSRERIAAWVATIEARLQVSEVAETELVVL
jgi:hypothetical protein